MNETGYNEDHLADLLPVYYKRIFPTFFFHRWLCYGHPEKFDNREISFTLVGNIYIRYQSFNTIDDFAEGLRRRIPIKIDIGAFYKTSPRYKNVAAVLTPVEKEIVFDIDLTDYDEVRTCCSRADVCKKCWKFMAIACKILEAALKEDFAFEHQLWVFSGRRGIHCWVADKAARMLDDDGRNAIADYLQVIKGGLKNRKVKLPAKIHPSIRRAINIIDKYFIKSIVIEQDILGNDERIDAFLSFAEEAMLKSTFKSAMKKHATSEKRWQAFQDTFNDLMREKKIPKYLCNIIEELKLYYAYPRLDINVTRDMGHLLKAPFCIHPKTGKVAVPFNPKSVDYFNPDAVPTINQLLNEIDAYDAQTKAQEKELLKTDKQGSVKTENHPAKIREYKKTSLLKYVVQFSNFLREAYNAEIKTETEMDE